MSNQTIAEGKIYAAVAYLTLIGTLISFFMNREKRNDFTSFHIRQALGLGLSYLALSYVVGSFDNWSISGAFMLLFVFCYVYGLYGALTGSYNKIPMVGVFFQKLFKSVGQ